MPDQPLWLQRLPQIIARLETVSTPVVDRFAVEQLFQVSRRQAIRLMHHFGGYQAGRTFLIERAGLVSRLQEIAQGAPVSQVLERKRRIWHELQEHAGMARAASVLIPQVERFPALGFAGLPEGIRLERGRLEVTFTQPEELLQKLYLLSQALAAEYDKFASEYDSAAEFL